MSDLPRPNGCSMETWSSPRRPTGSKLWRHGFDRLRVSQDDRWPVDDLYGEYVSQVDQSLRLYSGFVSLPPHLRYVPDMLAVLKSQPLAPGHNGCQNMSEQGVMAAAFTRLGATAIPLSEFPFGRAFEDFIDYGLRGAFTACLGLPFRHRVSTGQSAFPAPVRGRHFIFAARALPRRSICLAPQFWTVGAPGLVDAP